MVVLTAMSLEGTMIWFIVTTVLVVLVIGGGMALAVHTYDKAQKAAHAMTDRTAHHHR